MNNAPGLADMGSRVGWLLLIALVLLPDARSQPVGAVRNTQAGQHQHSMVQHHNPTGELTHFHMHAPQVAAQAPCRATTQPLSTAVLRSAQQLPQQRRAALATKPVTKVQTWQQLVDAVKRHSSSNAGTQWTLIELHSSGPLVATSTLNLPPGLAVLARKQVKVTCAEGVKTAFSVQLEGTTLGR